MKKYLPWKKYLLKRLVMDKIWIIIKREYSVRVRKKSFIIMTLITPILLGLLIFTPAYLSSELEESEQKNISVVENDDFYFSRLTNSDKFRFTLPLNVTATIFALLGLCWSRDVNEWGTYGVIKQESPVFIGMHMRLPLTV